MLSVILKNTVIVVQGRRKDRMEKDAQPRIALFIDFDNMLDFLTPDSISRLLNKLRDLGRIEHAGIYTDVCFVANSGKTKDYGIILRAYEQGCKIFHCPKLNGREKPKDTVDENIITDIHTLLETRPDISHFVLASHDSNFLRSANAVSFRGKNLVVVMNDPAGNRRLEQIADDVIFLSELETPENKEPAPPNNPLAEFLNQRFADPESLYKAVRELGLNKNDRLRLALDAVININSMPQGEYPYKYLVDYLAHQGQFTFAQRTDEGAIRGAINDLIGCNILLRQTKPDFKFYVLDPTHMFVIVALNSVHLEVLKALLQD